MKNKKLIVNVYKPELNDNNIIFYIPTANQLLIKEIGVVCRA